MKLTKSTASESDDGFDAALKEANTEAPVSSFIFPPTIDSMQYDRTLSSLREPIMKQLTIVVLVASLLPAVAMAQDSGKYQCTFGEMQRRVEIAHEPGVEVPCSVHYFKDTEMPGEQQVLWSADNDANYCKSKAMEFVAKLEGLGWDCGQGINTAIEDDVVDETDETDETDATVTEEMLGEPDAADAPDLD